MAFFIGPGPYDDEEEKKKVGDNKISEEADSPATPPLQENDPPSSPKSKDKPKQS